MTTYKIVLINGVLKLSYIMDRYFEEPLMIEKNMVGQSTCQLEIIRPKEFFITDVADMVFTAFYEDLLELELSHMIFKAYPELNIDEKAQLFLDIWLEFDKFKMWKITLYNDILASLEKTQDIVLDGFLNFKISYIKERWKVLMDYHYQKIVVQRQYLDFIDMLKIFVELQEPKLDEVHIIAKEDGHYSIYDKFDINLDALFLQPLKFNVKRLDLTNEDMLISCLITISPHNIYIHGKKDFYDASILETINKVFGKKVKTVGI